MNKFDNQLNIICLETEAFYALVEEVTNRIKKQYTVKEDIWISDDEAMELLRIKSRTTLQKLRDEGSIGFSHPKKRIILYHRQSILDYLESHSDVYTKYFISTRF